MNKNLRDIDELFRSPLQFYEEIPSNFARDKLFASLDQADAESYKRRFRAWKRTAIALCFLLLGFVLYETGIMNTRRENLEKESAIEKRNQVSPGKKANEKNDGFSATQITDGSAVKLKNNAGLSKPDDNSNKDAGQGGLSTRRQYKSDSMAKETTLTEDPSVVSTRTPKTQSQDIYAFTLLQENNPSPSIARKPFNVQIDNDSYLQLLNLLENQNKYRIGFRPHWLVSAVFSYEAAGYRLDSDLPNEISNIKHREVHEPSYSGGLLITRQLTVSWGLQSGLLYSKTNIGLDAQKIYAFQNPAGDVAYKYVTSSGYAYIKPKTGSPPSFGDSVIATEGKHTIDYVTVPLSIKYRAGKNRFSFVPGVSIEANFLTGTRVETEIQTPVNSEMVFFNKLYGAKPFYWSVAADAELRYNLNNKTMISFRPAFHHAISPITENNIVETFPYSFRWGGGLTIKL